MGGKSNQRTKNNVRPSSSSRSAELLNSARLDAGLVMAGGKVLPALFPSLAGALLDAGLTPEFALSLKKLNKKDPKTKTKALQELTELVKNSKVEDVVALLPTWAHFYRILTVDIDRKVREATQVCHSAVVASCGRRIAPHLKQLMPAWLQAQHDEHAPAQSLAHASLTNTFPESKLPEVISFCREEVVSYLVENIDGGVEDAVNKKTEDPEQREQLYSRQMSASLNGLEYVIERLPADHGPWLWDQLAPLLKSTSFWKLPTHPQPTLRSSWYQVVGGMASRFGTQFTSQHGQRAARILLTTSSGGPAAAQLWACLLQLLHADEDWHKWVDKKDLLVKRIMDMLENGGWGSARRLSDVLLPLLAKMPPDLLTEAFLEDFFNAAFQGLEKKAVLCSKSERQAWITSISECLRYVSIQEQAYVGTLVLRVHRDWVTTSLQPRDEPLAAHLIRHCGICMAALLKYWLKRSKDSDRFDLLVRSFWENITSTIVGEMEKASKDSEEVVQMMERHVTLLITLKNAVNEETKKQRSIKFSADGADCEAEQPQRPAEPCSVAMQQRYSHGAALCLARCGAAALRLCAARRCVAVAPRLLPHVDSRLIATELGLEGVYQLYEVVLRPWLLDEGNCSRSVVELVFILLTTMNGHEQDRVFISFDLISSTVVEWCISVASCHPYCSLDSARRWLAGPRVRLALVAACTRALTLAQSHAHLLLTCLAVDEHGELLVGSETVQGVVASCCSVMQQRLRDFAGAEDVTPDLLEPVARCGAALSTSLAAHAPQLLPTLVAALFRLTLTVPLGSAALSADTWREVVCSWQDAAAAFSTDLRDAFLIDAVRALRDLLFENMEQLNITKIENLAYLCPYLLSQSETDSPALGELVALTRRMFDQLFDDHSSNILIHALRHDCVFFALNCPVEDCNVIKQIVQESNEPSVKELTKEALMPYVYRVLFRAIYLRTILIRKPGVLEEDDEDEEDEEEKTVKENEPTWCDAVLEDKAMLEELCNVFYDHAVVCSLYEGYGYWPHFDIIYQTKRKLDAVLADIPYDTSVSSHCTVLDTLATLAAAQGYYWSLTTPYNKGHTSLKWDIEKITMDNLSDVITGSGYFHSLQAACKSTSSMMQQGLQLQVMRCMQLAHEHEQLLSLEADLRHDADFLVNIYYAHNHVMLFERDITTASWRQVVSNTAACEYLAALVEAKGWELPANQWDFTTITLCSIVNSVEKTKHAWGSTKVAMLARAALRLYVAVAQFVADLPTACEQRQPSDHVAALLNEWRDVFAPDISSNLRALITHILESRDTEMTSSHVAVVAALQQSVAWLRHGPAPPDPARLASLAADTLAAPAPHPLHYLAHSLLTLLLKPLVLQDAERLAAWSNSDSETDSKPRPEFMLSYLQPSLTLLHEALDLELTDVRPGEEVVQLEPHSRVHSRALSCLLLDCILLAACRLQRNDLTLHYIEMCRELRFSEQQLTLALRLLPREVIAHALEGGTAPAEQAFLQDHEFSALQPPLATDICLLACRVLFGAVSGVGVARVRAWAGTAPPRAARALRAAVATHITPTLVRDQLCALAERRHELPDTEIRVHWSTQEAVCVYQVEERALTLTVTLSPAHPLVPPRALVPPGQHYASCTSWIALYLAYQNGTVLNAFKMWCSAVSARVEAAPQCYICYCRLHPATGKLPAVLCHQCRNKFHSQCLRKWFTSSNKSNCPLCRSAF